VNTGKTVGFRRFAIAAVLAGGIATTIATGGSGRLSPGGSTTTDPTLVITVDNGEAVASTVVIAIGMSFDLGEVSDISLLGPSNSAFGNLPGKPLESLYAKAYAQDPQAIEGCVVSGTVDYTITIADPNLPTVGDHIVAVFDECDDDLGYVISGTVDMTVSALQGDYTTGMFLIGFDMLLTDVVVTEGLESVTSNGDFTLTLDSRSFPVIIMSMAGDSLEASAAGETMSITAFDHSLTVDLGTVPDTKVAEVFGRLTSLVHNGSVDYETLTPVQGIDDFEPHAGVILVTGADGSTIRIILVDSANVTLEIDSNGDGVVDAYVYTSWPELNGQPPPNGGSSLINSSTALDVAREAYNAVVGFGSVATSTGGQFAAGATFGQVQDLGVSGTFGPLSVDCALSGTADVSGSVAAAGSYTAGDLLDATFLACARGGEVLDGALSFSVASFDQTPGGTYLVSGTATQDAYRRFVAGSCHTGTGMLTTTHDFMYAATGIVSIDSSASSYFVASLDAGQSLTAAVVHTQVEVGPQPAVITRTSSGSFTSPVLIGSYQYQSLVPDVFLLDDDATTGPYSGELLVTASDNSTLRMVALDQAIVRLDLDFDGDSVIDDQIPATWIDFDYGNSFGLCETAPAP